MRSIRTLIVTGCIITLVLALVSCSKIKKTEAIGKIGDVTYSKNFSGQLTEANIWVERNFEFHNALNKQDVTDKKEMLESVFTKSLRDLENEKHEIYFKWVEIATEPLEFKVSAYLTPAPKRILSGTQMVEGGSDPQNPSAPPPPYP
jgi:hypothetical protein